MKFESIKVGDTLWDVRREFMGNTTMRTTTLAPVRVEAVDTEQRRALVRWNHNPARWWTERMLRRLRAKKPELVSVTGSQRLLRRGEKSRGAQ